MEFVLCKICKKEFSVKPSHLKLGWGKYCSNECRWKGQLKGKIVDCYMCKKGTYRSPKELRVSKSGKFFCSKSCQTIWRNTSFMGPLSANWKYGGSTYRNTLIKSDKKQACRLCKIDNPIILAAHHKDHNRKNNALDNLTWLCFNCHYLVHHDIELNKKVLEMD